MIPDIVHHNQNVYVKGRPIFDAVRAIDDILECTVRGKIQGFMVAINFKKHFMLEMLSALYYFHKSSINIEVLDRETLYHRTCLLSVSKPSPCVEIKASKKFE